MLFPEVLRKSFPDFEHPYFHFHVFWTQEELGTQRAFECKGHIVPVLLDDQLRCAVFHGVDGSLLVSNLPARDRRI